jgi:hypothetical protein
MITKIFLAWRAELYILQINIYTINMINIITNSYANNLYNTILLAWHAEVWEIRKCSHFFKPAEWQD